MNIGELFIKIGANVSPELESAFSSIRKNVLTITTAAIGAGYAFDKFLSSTTTKVIDLTNASERLGLSTLDLQKWGNVGKAIGSSFEEVQGNIGNLQKKLTELQMFGGDIRPFAIAGINIAGKNAFDVLKELRNNIQGLDSRAVNNIVEKMGLSPAMVNILKLSNTEFNKLAGNRFLSTEQLEQVKKMGMAINQLKNNMVILKDDAVAKLAPRLNDLLEGFFKWMEKNGDKISDTIGSIADFFGRFAIAVGRASALIVDFIESVFGAENGIKVLAGIIGALALSFSPVLAGLSAIILLLEDIAVWRKGGDSLFGGLYQGISDFITGIQKMYEIIKPIFSWLDDVLTSITENINKFLGAFKNTLTGGIFGKIGETLFPNNLQAEEVSSSKLYAPVANNSIYNNQGNQTSTSNENKEIKVNIVNNITGGQDTQSITDMLMNQYKMTIAKYGN